MKKKIGIMGGTFDPPHLGHLILAEQARLRLELAEVWFVPAGKIAHKESAHTAPASDRLNLVRLAVADNPFFRVNTIETERSGWSYTYQTMEILTRRHPDTDFVFIVGADSLDYMEHWREPERIFRACTVAAACRGGISLERLQAKRLELTERFGARILLFEMPLVEISSTQIREILQKGGSARYLTPEPVAAYIAEHGLYRR